MTAVATTARAVDTATIAGQLWAEHGAPSPNPRTTSTGHLWTRLVNHVRADRSPPAGTTRHQLNVVVDRLVETELDAEYRQARVSVRDVLAVMWHVLTTPLVELRSPTSPAEQSTDEEHLAAITLAIPAEAAAMVRPSSSDDAPRTPK